MRFIFLFFAVIYPVFSFSATKCVPVSTPNYFTGPGAPHLICRFHGPFGLYGWLVSKGERGRVIYYSTTKDGQVFFRGPIYNRFGLPVSPNIYVAKRGQR
ncbi:MULTISPECIES: hypothetical protein [Acidithiobacillus]|jgi:hypothetical protein|uniref:hypothetical protein n=1 Tax=Acidithiobacillus TaxID=119977 RepID=UPI000B024814|nr:MULTISPECIES: hypothetical protein [Acidithiobacillus]